MECWANAEESNTKGKNKKKKKKSKALKCENDHVRNMALPDASLKCLHLKVVIAGFLILIETYAENGTAGISCSLSSQVLELRSFL